MNPLATMIAVCALAAGGTLPDPACTPGKVAAVSLQQLCDHSYERTRKVSSALKRKTFTEYGLDIRKVKGAWEVDHLVPRCLGGADVIENLWPEQNYQEKDQIEARVCREVCGQRRGLEKARDAFKTDWRTLR